MSVKWSCTTVLAVALLLGSCACDALDRQDTVVAAVVVDFTSPSKQSREFRYRASGRYEVGYLLTLRDGPGSSMKPLEVAGTISIRDADGRLELRRPFHESLQPFQQGGSPLASFRSYLPGREPHVLSIELTSSRDLAEAYSGMEVSLRHTTEDARTAALAAFTSLVASLGVAAAVYVLRFLERGHSDGGLLRVAGRALLLGPVYVAMMFAGYHLFVSLADAVTGIGVFAPMVFIAFQWPGAHLVRFACSGRLEGTKADLLLGALTSVAIWFAMLAGVMFVGFVSTFPVGE